jgi:hypothetical protein
MTDKTLSELFAETASLTDEPQARATLALAAAVLQSADTIARSIAIAGDEVANRLNGLDGISFSIQDLGRLL